MLSGCERSSEIMEDLKFAVESLEKQAFKDIRVALDGYEAPSKITQKQSGEDFTPDITAFRDGTKVLFELAIRSDDHSLVRTKWQLLTQISKMKDDSFVILVPKGNLSFANTMLKEPNIDAEVIRMF